VPDKATVFPTLAVRDALGLVRLLFGAHLKRRGLGPYHRIDPGSLPPLGRELARAMDMAAQHPAGSPGHDAAIRRAERALGQLRDLCDDNEVPSGRELVDVAHARVRGFSLVSGDSRPPKGPEAARSVGPPAAPPGKAHR
jgi:hypothetical protein